ncbi:MAG: hypothetical protein V4674_00120 [Patescibacteria group bacterium]
MICWERGSGLYYIHAEGEDGEEIAQTFTCRRVSAEICYSASDGPKFTVWREVSLEFFWHAIKHGVGLPADVQKAFLDSKDRFQLDNDLNDRHEDPNYSYTKPDGSPKKIALLGYYIPGWQG